jgi:hypothetical protein
MALHHVIAHRPRHLIIANTDCAASASLSSTLSCGVGVVLRNSRHTKLYT